MTQTSTTTGTSSVEDYTSREEWLEARRRSIGSSDIAALVGESRYASPLSLWMEKTGRSVPEDEPENELFEWGHRNEPAIAAKALEVLREEIGPCSIEDPGDFALERSGSLPFATASLDREVYQGYEHHRIAYRVAVLELKNPGEWMKRIWIEEVPLLVQIQAQWQMLVTGLGTDYVAALLGGNSFRWAHLIADETLQEILQAAAADFWDCVERDIEPKADGHEATRRALYQRYSTSDGTEVKLGVAAEEAWAMLVAAKARKKGAEETADELTNVLIQEIGEADQGVLPDGTILGLNRISIDAKTIERKASSHLRLTRRGAYGHLQQKEGPR